MNQRIRIIAFDVDDTLWYGVADERVADRFSRLDDRRVADGVGTAQELVENARDVLVMLAKEGYKLALATMGPEDQVRAFMVAFGIDHLFDFSISAFDREDKGEKIEKIWRRASVFMDVAPGQILYVDDNLGYLKAANDHLPDVKCTWAHFRMSPGLLALNEDVQEMHGFSLW